MLARPKKASELEKFLEKNHPFLNQLTPALLGAPVVSGISFLSHLSAGSNPLAVAALGVATVGSVVIALKSGDMMRELMADFKKNGASVVSAAVQNVPTAEVLKDAKSEITTAKSIALDQVQELASGLTNSAPVNDADPTIPSPWGKRP